MLRKKREAKVRKSFIHGLSTWRESLRNASMTGNVARFPNAKPQNVKYNSLTDVLKAFIRRSAWLRDRVQHCQCHACI